MREITALANDVYAVAEAGLWQPGITRTTATEIAEAIDAGQVIAAYLDDDVGGVVRTSVRDRVGWFGMLAVRPGDRGLGIGRRLVAAAEESARTARAVAMRITVLTPTGAPNAAKTELARWYRSLGYQHLGPRGMAEELPVLVPLLAVPCHLETFRKPLAPLATT